ncbi:unnamed protein product [Chrysoparadoxa australica]
MLTLRAAMVIFGALAVVEVVAFTPLSSLRMATEQSDAELLDRVAELSAKVKELTGTMDRSQSHRVAAAVASVQETAAAPATPPAPVATGLAPVPKREKGGAKPLVCASLEDPSDEFVMGATVNALEVTPYYDQSQIPLNLFKPKSPYPGKLQSVTRLVGPKSPGEVMHIVIDHDGNMPYWEGQSIGIIPPGVDAAGKPHKLRLYSIASTRYGDDGQGKTVSFCIRRALYIDPETGKEDPAKKGVCSNYLCDAAAGTEVQMIGPSGKILLLPEAHPETDIIMVGTGTGIAPYRGFIRRLFQEDTPAARAYTGLAWLFLGVANTDSLLYHDDLMSVIRKNPFNFRYSLALSREQKNANGGKMYIQDRMEEHADELFERLDNGGHIYFCGLKGMMPGIEAMLQRVAEQKGLVWKDVLSGLKKKGQWHCEVRWM